LPAGAKSAGSLAALALVSHGRNADDALEVPGQVCLVSESDLCGYVRGVHAVVEQQPRSAHSQLVQVSVRRQARLGSERPEQCELIQICQFSKFCQARRVGEPFAQEITGGADCGRRPPRRTQASGWAASSMRAQDAGQRQAQ